MKADDNSEQLKDYIKEIKLKAGAPVIIMDYVMWSVDPVNDSILKITERMYAIAIQFIMNIHEAKQILLAGNITLLL